MPLTTVLLVDSSKFLASAAVHLCGWDEISAVVTDAAPPAEAVERLPRLAEIVEVAGRE